MASVIRFSKIPLVPLKPLHGNQCKYLSITRPWEGEVKKRNSREITEIRAMKIETPTSFSYLQLSFISYDTKINMFLQLSSIQITMDIMVTWAGVTS